MKLRLSREGTDAPVREPDWRDVLWREWLHGDDRRVALAVYEHLAGDRPRWEAMLLAGLSTLLLGAAHGVAVTLVLGALTGGGCRVALGMGLGAAVGALAGWVLRALVRTWHGALDVLHRVLPALLSWENFILPVVGDLASLAVLRQEGVTAPARVRAVLLAVAAGLWVLCSLARLLLPRAGFIVKGIEQGRASEAALDPPSPWLLWWWRGRPTRGELAWAQDGTDAPPWVRGALAARGRRESLDDLVADLEAGTPARRARAFEELAGRGTRVLLPLLERTHGFTALTALAALVRRANTRGRSLGAGCVCPGCLCRFGTVVVRPGKDAVTFYGCPSCHQSERHIEQPGPIVAVLDSERDAKLRRRHGALRVNWIARAKAKGFEGSELFDWDSVEIVRATDQEVEHFLVDVANDTDTKRAKRYGTMRCAVGPECDLSEGTLRKLREVFGVVEVRRSDPVQEPT